MFWFGVLVGIVITCGLFWWLYGPDGVLRTPASLDSHHDVFDLERRTIDSMLNAEMAARRNGGDLSEDVVEGTARDVAPRRP